MKKYEAKYWRSNPQLKNGGSVRTKIIEARNEKSAWNKASKATPKVSYGSFHLLSVTEMA